MLTQSDVIQDIGPYVHDMCEKDILLEFQAECIAIRWAPDPSKWAVSSREALALLIQEGRSEVVGPIAAALVAGKDHAEIVIRPLAPGVPPGDQTSPSAEGVHFPELRQKAVMFLSIT